MGIAADFVLIVLAGLVGGLLARALKLPLLVGYVIAGVVVGPNTAGPTVGDAHEIELLAEIGVALLLFSLGLEISLRDLQTVRKIALIGGPVQIVLTASAAAFAAHKALDIPVNESIWLGAMVSLSSTMVVLKTLSSAGVTSTLASRVMIGLLVIQDLAVIPMLMILPQLGAPEGVVVKLIRSVGIAAALLLTVVMLGTRILPWLLTKVLTWGSRELFLVSVVATGVGVGFATYSAGLSFALGAFIAGMVLSESELSHQALSDVVPLRDIFGLLFFVTVGMLFDPSFLVTHIGLISISVCLIVVGKALISGGIARAFGYVNMAPWIVGLGLSQIGEFSFVLARTGLSMGQLSKETYDLALTCTVVTMAISPVVSGAALPIGRLWRRWRKQDQVLMSIELSNSAMVDHVVVAGYGRNGRAVTRVLLAANIPVVLAEWDHAAFSDASAQNIEAVWGDIGQDVVLHATGIENARMIILTVPDNATIRLAANRARAINPKIIVIARAVLEHNVPELRGAGVDRVVQPEFEGGIEIVRQALVAWNFDRDEAWRLIKILRAELYGTRTSAFTEHPS
jgi:monovalent cation:H+ antiporter-2, CPA2 family